MPSTKDIVLLAVDDAIVTMGAQFREVALGLLITALNPRFSSYAWYFLASSIPGLVFARGYAWASQRFGARGGMMISYGARFLLVLGLWQTANFWVALAIMAGITTGSGLYAASQAHYMVLAGDFIGIRNTVIRLRQSTSLMLLIGPLFAGLVLDVTGYRSGFLFSGAAYGIALLAVSQLSSQGKGRPAVSFDRIDWRPDRPSTAMLGLSFLTWQANTLAMAYIFHVLHRHAFGYGLTLAVWGGSGLLASLWLSRIHIRPMRWIPRMFVVLGASWFTLSYGMSFPIFVVLGGIEGFANWMVQDLSSAFILSGAPAGKAGRARAKLGAFDEIGSIAGILTILVIPGRWLVLPMYAVLGILGLSAAGAWLVFERWTTGKREKVAGNLSAQDEA